MLGPIKKAAFRKFRESESRLHQLNYLFWECTTRCNLDCLHCGSDCQKEGSFRDMPLEDFLAALDTIPSLPENLIVVLTGGEPLLRKDLEICGREIRKRGMRWSLVSNGLQYHKERHISLLNAGLGALTFSIDGMEESHNWLRNNPNSFAKVDQAIGLAVGSTRLNFDVVTCVHQKNLHELSRVYQYLVAKKVKAWRLFTITPIGRAKCNPDLLLSDAQLKELMEFISVKRKDEILDVKFSCEGYVGPYESKVRGTPFFCRAGINIGSILIDGSISACPNIDRSFTQGTIYRDDFYEVWQNHFEPFRERTWMRKGKCATCGDYRDCLGNGFHHWHGDHSRPLVCHKEKLEHAIDQISPTVVDAV